MTICGIDQCGQPATYKWFVWDGVQQRVFRRCEKHPYHMGTVLLRRVENAGGKWEGGDGRIVLGVLPLYANHQDDTLVADILAELGLDKPDKSK